MIDNVFIDGFQIHGGIYPAPTLYPGDPIPGEVAYGLTQFGIGSPGPRAVTESRPSAHGASDATMFYGPRTVELVGRVLAPDTATLWPLVDNLKGALRLGSWHVLKFRRTGLTYDERFMVRVDSPVDIPLVLGSTRMVTFGVSLFAPDPRIYTDTTSSAEYDPTSTGAGGLSFSLGFALAFGAGGSATLNAVNEGNIDTPPTFTITGPVTNPVITNETTGQAIYTTGLGLSTGETLTIDVEARQARLGTTPRPDLIDSALTTWFELAPGTNALRMTGTGMSATLTELAVSWRSARI